MPKPVLCFGEILWDLFPDGPVLGGAPFNLAYRLAERGETVRMASRVGTDELGVCALRQARELGVDVSLIQTDPARPTGTVRIKLAGGEPDYMIVPDVAYDRIELTDSLADAAADAVCLCFGTLAQRAEDSRRTLESLLYLQLGVLTFCDINLRRDCYSAETVSDSLLRADILKLNREETLLLSGMLFDEKYDPMDFGNAVLDQLNPKIVLITLGEQGVLGLSEEAPPVYAPGYKVRVADTVGSGDAFSAGFLHRYLAGDSLARACDFGCRLGALAATQSGGTGGLTPQMISELVDSAERLEDSRYSQYVETEPGAE